MTPPHDLSDEFELRGDFCLPERPDHCVKGVLRYSDGAIELNLLGTFRDDAGVPQRGGRLRLAVDDAQLEALSPIAFVRRIPRA